MTPRIDNDNESSYSDSFSEDLSPTDGYFSPLNIPRNVFLEVPGSSQASGHVKTDHVSAELPRHVASSSSRVYSHHAQNQYTRPSEQASLFNPMESPPTYASIMAPSQRYDYRRLSNDGDHTLSPEAEERTGFLSESNGPQSMGAPRDYQEERNSRNIFQRIKHLEWWTISRRIKAGVVILAIIVLAGVLAGFARPNNSTKAPVVNDPSPILDEPVKEPVESSSPNVPQPPPRPLPPATPNPPNELVLWPAHCGAQQTPKDFEFAFDQSEFRFSENIEGLDHALSGIFGEIHVVVAPEDQATDVNVKFSVMTSSPIDVEDLVAIKTPYAIEIEGVDYELADIAGIYCMRLETIISLKANLTLDNFDIDSRNMHAQIHDEIDLNVKGLTSITLTKGSFKSSLFTSRQTKVVIGSGTITGQYALLDRLILKTESGAIDVDVDPREKDPEKPKPALFCAHSHSGSIKARYDVSALPERDYQTKIESGMGSIEGKIAHGSETEIKATSGSIKVDVTPYSATNETSTLSTSTMSGSTHFNLFHPYSNPGGAIEALESTHDGKSGSMTITYPQEWVGKVSGGTLSGRVSLSGRDLKDIVQGGGRAGQQITATKGSGKSMLKFNNMSGSCRVQVGDA